jgi:hypothetical protein
MDDGYRLKHLPPPNRSLPRQVDYDASRDPRLKRVDIQSGLNISTSGPALLTLLLVGKNSGDKRDGGHLPHLHGEPELSTFSLKLIS